MPKISQEAAQERRDQIIEAALRCFAEKGLSRVTLRDVFEEAGLSAGAVYNYFSSKDEIIVEVARAGISEALEAFDRPDGDTGLGQVIDHFLTALDHMREARTPRIDIMIVCEALSNPEVHDVVRRNRAAVKAGLTQLVRRRQESGVWAEQDPQVVAELLYTTYQGLVMSVALGEDVDVMGVRDALKAMRFD